MQEIQFHEFFMNVFPSLKLSTLIQFSEMTEANLQPSWPSYQSYNQVYCLHSYARYVHNFRIATLGETFLRRQVQQGMYTTKKMLYIYKACESTPSLFHVL